MLDALLVADAFNQQNSKKHWKARTGIKRANDNAQFVHFEGSGIVVLALNCSTSEWFVSFNKFQAAWGDYVAAIVKAYYVVSNTLVSAGFDMQAPLDLEAVRIEISYIAGERVTKVRCYADNAPLENMLSADQKEQYENNFKI